MNPQHTEQTYVMTEKEFKQSLGIPDDENLTVVTLHENKDGNKIEVRTSKGQARITNYKQTKGGY